MDILTTRQLSGSEQHLVRPSTIDILLLPSVPQRKHSTCAVYRGSARNLTRDPLLDPSL